jgi:hypothetical protein
VSVDCHRCPEMCDRRTYQTCSPPPSRSAANLSAA